MRTDRLAIDGGEPAVTRRLPLGKGIDLIGDDEIDAVTAVLRDRSLFRYHSSRTPARVDAFESAVCDAFGCRYALAVSSGTAALRAALAALGCRPGDEVIVPAFTFIATVSAVVTIGAEPVFAEVDDTLTLDPSTSTQGHSERTAAIVPVHLENVAADMEALGAVAASARRADPRGRRAGDRRDVPRPPCGTIGALGACSLQETKNITTGEGGIVCTDDDDLYVRAARFHDQGGQFVTQYRGERGPDRGPPFMGDNLRMTEIAGAIGIVQLAAAAVVARVDAWRTTTSRTRSAPSTDGQPRRIPDPAVPAVRASRGCCPTPTTPAGSSPRSGPRARRRRRCTRAGRCTRTRPCRTGRRPTPNATAVRGPRIWSRARSRSASVPRSPSRTAIRSRPRSTRSHDSATVWCGVMRAGFGTAVDHARAPRVPRGLRRPHRDRRNRCTTTSKLRVLVVEDDQTRAALVTCDLLAMTRDFSDPIRAAVAELVETDVAVLTSCTHVHAGPSTLTGTDAIGWPVPEGYRELLVARPGDATGAAVAALAPASLRSAPRSSTATSRSTGAATHSRPRLVGRVRRRRDRRQLRHPSDGHRSEQPRGLDRLGRPVPADGRTATPAYPSVLPPGLPGRREPVGHLVGRR